MSKRRRKRQSRSRKPAPPRRPAPRGPSLVTPEGDPLVFVSAQYQHTAPEKVRTILSQTDDFGLDDESEPQADNSLQFPWFETRPGIPSLHAPIIGQRVLANLTLAPTTLVVEAMSQRRLDDCCRRLEQLLGDHIHLIETEAKDMDQALRERKPRAAPQEPVIPPPEVIAEIEEMMLRQWIDDSIPALGGLTPRQAVKTPEGRRQVLELIDHATRMQKAMRKTPGVFAPDYRKVKKMLGLE
jgi:hypothetical protein